MRILLQNRDEKQFLGGDVIHLRNYQKALQDLGVDADYSYDEEADLTSYDQVWLFHINFEWSYNQMINCRKYNKPFVLFPIFFENIEQGMSKEKMKELLVSAQHVFCLSKQEAQKMELFLDVKRHVYCIPNGVDKNIFRPLGDKYTFGNGYVFTAGRMEYLKGHHLLVEACKRLNLPLIIAGDFSQQLRYKEMCEALYNKVYFVGKLDQHTLAKYYRGCRLFTLLSTEERGSLVLLEAASCGATVLAPTTNFGNEWVPFVTVDRDNKQEVIKKISLLWNNPYTISQQKIPSWEQIIKQVLSTLGIENNLYISK